jgi:hypothetical protein
MDPNATLEELLALVEQHFETDGEPLDEHDVARMAELVSALDGWIVNGGFLPQRWSVTRG